MSDIKPISASAMRWMAIGWLFIGSIAAILMGPLANLICVAISSVFLVGGSIMAKLETRQ